MAEIFRGPDSSPNCANCPCATNGAPTRPIKGAGAIRSLAIIGEGPTAEDLSQGWPLVGPSGKLLQQALNAAGIDRHTIWITNSILCQRPHSDEKLQQAIECCKPRLQHEITLVGPTAILALGGSAAEALALPVNTIKAARGTIQQSELAPTVPCVTAMHPGAILKGGGAGPAKGTTSDSKSKMNVDAQYVFLESDVAKAYNLACNPSQPLWQDDIDLAVEPIDTNIAKIAMFENAKLLAIDLEWDKNDKITWLGLATPEHAISVYWPNMDGLARAWISRIGKRNIPKLFHNLQADVPIWEAQIGPLGGVFEDTMLLHHAAYPGAAHDLQNVATQFLLVPPWKADRKSEEKAAVKATRQAASAAKKAEKQAAHSKRNAATAAGAAERKTARIAAHNERNASAKKKKLSASDILKLLGDN